MISDDITIATLINNSIVKKGEMIATIKIISFGVKDSFIKKPNEHIFIPLQAIHRIQNPGKKPVKIMEAQVGSILKETDIVRYQDVYGRVK